MLCSERECCPIRGKQGTSGERIHSDDCRTVRKDGIAVHPVGARMRPHQSPFSAARGRTALGMSWAPGQPVPVDRSTQLQKSSSATARQAHRTGSDR